jgi:hypothetical protein
MPVTEESRHRLHQKLDETIGPEDAATLMEHLPPVGWADVATKQDVAHRFEMLEVSMNAGFTETDLKLTEHSRHLQVIDRRLDKIDDRIEKVQDSVRQQTIRLVMFLMAYGAVLVAAVAQIKGG